MTDQLISFETAKLAKEKGFTWDNGMVEIDKRMFPNLPDKIKRLPTQSLLQKWLRETFNIHIWIEVTISIFTNKKPEIQLGYKYHIKVYCNPEVMLEEEFTNKSFSDTHEKELEIALQEALKLL